MEGECDSGLGFYVLLGLAFLLVSLGIIAAKLVPGHRSAGPLAREKACYANQRVIQWAIEMYNQDHGSNLATLDAEVERGLERMHYLKGPILRPEAGCAYQIQPVGGTMTCAIHGRFE